MTTQTLQPRHPSVRNAGLAIAGAGLVVAGAYGVTSWVLDDGAITAPGQNLEQGVNPGDVRDPSLDRLRPEGVPGTEHGVRDSWMPPGAAPGLPDRKLEQLR